MAASAWWVVHWSMEDTEAELTMRYDRERLLLCVLPVYQRVLRLIAFPSAHHFGRTMQLPM